MKQFITTLLLTLVLSITTSAVHAYGFKFEDSNGKTHTLTDYRGKWVLINFWATWCPPCLKEMPDLAALYQSREDIMIIGIALEYDDTKTVLEFTEKMAIPYPIVMGDRETVAQIGDDISLLPSTYLFDPQGKPAARRIGLITRDEIEMFISSKVAHPQAEIIHESPSRSASAVENTSSDAAKY